MLTARTYVVMLRIMSLVKHRLQCFNNNASSYIVHQAYMRENKEVCLRIVMTIIQHIVYDENVWFVDAFFLWCTEKTIPSVYASVYATYTQEANNLLKVLTSQYRLNPTSNTLRIYDTEAALNTCEHHQYIRYLPNQ